MEYRTGDVIINIDRKMNEVEENFIKAQANFIMGVLLAGNIYLVSTLMAGVIKEVNEDLSNRIKERKKRDD